MDQQDPFYDAEDHERRQLDRNNPSSDDSCSASTRCSAALEASEAIDRIAVMRLQEVSDAYRCVDYFSHNNEGEAPESPGSATDINKPVDAECRTKMCEWCEKVVDSCQFSRETVCVAMSILDRFLTSSLTDGHPTAVSAQGCRKEYQLAAMTSLYIAVKLNEAVEMDTELVSEMSRGCYSAQEVADMELDMLDALGWSLSGPTPQGFLGHFLALLPARTKYRAEALLLELGRRQTDLAVSDTALVHFDPSSIAVAALMNSIEAVNNSLMSPEDKIAFLNDVRNATDIDIAGNKVRFIRTRLLEAFGRSGECLPIQQDMVVPSSQQEQDPKLSPKKDKKKSAKSGKAMTPAKRRCSATVTMSRASRCRRSLGGIAA